VGFNSQNSFGFSLLSSGSKANCTLVTDSENSFLIDAGLSCRRTEQRLLELGYAMEELAGIIITHEHSDHVAGLKTMIKKYRPDIFATHQTAERCDLLDYDNLCRFSAGEQIELGGFDVETFPVWHDAAEPVGMVVSKGESRLGYCTDTGKVCPRIESKLRGLSALVLEANHDLDLLDQAPYPERLKTRIAGEHGHLGNLDAAELLRVLARGDERLQFIIAAHISENSNTPVIALRELEQAWAASGGWKETSFFAATATAATPLFQIRSGLSLENRQEAAGPIDVEAGDNEAIADPKQRERA